MCVRVCVCVDVYNLNGAFFSIGVVPRDVDAEVRSVRCVPGSAEPLRDGVCIPDGVDWPLSDFLGVGVLTRVGILDDRLMPTHLGGAGLAAPDLGLEEGVTPFDLVVEDVTPSRVGREADVEAVVARRVGMRLWLPSSALSNESVEPCLDGGFEPGRDPGLDVLVGVNPRDVYETLRGVYRPGPCSLSDNESGVDADNDDLPRDIGMDLTERSRTFIIGPCVGIPPTVGESVWSGSTEPERRGRNAAICCWTPSASMNFSRNSRFVRPLARQGSFFSKNSSKATQPPPTRTITVLRRIRTRRSFCESPNRYLPSPTWNTRNF